MDRFSIVLKRHVDDPDSAPVFVLHGDDNKLEALIKILTLPDDQLERWNAADFEVFKAGRGW